MIKNHQKKMHKLDLSKLYFWILLTGVSLALMLVIAVGLVPVSHVNNDTDVAPGLSREVISVRYYAGAAELVKSYIEKVGELNRLSVNSPYLDATVQAKNSALELLVPEEAKSVHLDLVIAFNFLEKGFNGSAEDLEEGVERLGGIIEENSWLTE
jgi:hypothetical protein